MIAVTTPKRLGVNVSATTFIGTTAATVGTAVAGSVASTQVRSDWYAQLDKPAIQPPGKVFGPVWTTLYADIAVTTGLALRDLAKDPEAATRYRAALALNLALNASWSWVFFRFHHLPGAVGVAGALAVSSVDLVRRTMKVNRKAGLALAPYAAWCTFATVLSTAVWCRNRGR